jgi:hypothetical protein
MMPTYRLTLVQNMDPRAPTGLQAIYTYNNGAQNMWWVTAVNPDPAVNTAVVVVTCATDIINQPNVLTRVLRAYYATAPGTLDYQISSVQS